LSATELGGKNTLLAEQPTVAEVTIKESVWQELVQVARRRRKKPEHLADAALREFLQRQADEELLEKSSRAAQKTSFPISQTEELIRQYRKRKKKR
jgi:predicted nucleic acid-binding protein